MHIFSQHICRLFGFSLPPLSLDESLETTIACVRGLLFVPEMFFALIEVVIPLEIVVLFLMRRKRHFHFYCPERVKIFFLMFLNLFWLQAIVRKGISHPLADARNHDGRIKIASKLKKPHICPESCTQKTRNALTFFELLYFILNSRPPFRGPSHARY